MYVRSHLGSSIQVLLPIPTSFANILSMVKYALCKHGIHCQEQNKEACGFAHRLAEVSLPDAVWDKRFLDDSDKKKGRAGIDVWFGQRYNLAQHTRVSLYVEHENPPYPDWVNMYLWFEGLIKEAPMVYEDFNLFFRIQEHLQPRMRGYVNAPMTVSALRAWRPPFEWALDKYGCTFADKLYQYCDRHIEYEVLDTVGPMQQVEEYRTSTSYHWGPNLSLIHI